MFNNSNSSSRNNKRDRESHSVKNSFKKVDPAVPVCFSDKLVFLFQEHGGVSVASGRARWIFSLGAGSKCTTWSCWSKNRMIDQCNMRWQIKHLDGIIPNDLILKLPLLFHANVTQAAPMWMNSSDDGRQIGRAKSMKVCKNHFCTYEFLLFY